MVDINGIKNELKLILPNIQLGKGGKNCEGGSGGSIMIITEEFAGSGEITTDGGDGIVGGKGGNVHIRATKNNFRGKISAKGGKSYGENK